MSQRHRTAFADILRIPPDVQEDGAEAAQVRQDTQQATPIQQPPRRNKAVSPDYTKLTAYIPRTLASAIKMSMALDQTADQSEYIERILAEWLQAKGRTSVLSQVGYIAIAP